VITRRGFLTVLGSLAVAGTGAATWRAADQGVFASGTGQAYAAWDEWNPPSSDVLGIVRAAILAANAHNSQPWSFRVSPTEISLVADTNRNIGAMDPLRREMDISLGCALENLTLAAQYRGRTPTVELRPDGALVHLGQSAPLTSPLFTAIPHRHTNRAAYSERPVTLDGLAALVDAPIDLVWPDKKAFSDLTVRATQAIIDDPDQSRDDYAWFRGDWHTLQSEKDGITIDASGQPALIRSAGKIMPASHDLNNDTWLTSTRDVQLPTAAAIGTFAVRDPLDPLVRLQAGRIWQRMHLWATSQGLAMQPINQIEERIDRERAAGLPPTFTTEMAALTPTGKHAIFSFRVGYPTMEALPSPRRRAEEVLAK
jgi:hypothetical protein